MNIFYFNFKTKFLNFVIENIPSGHLSQIKIDIVYWGWVVENVRNAQLIN